MTSAFFTYSFMNIPEYSEYEYLFVDRMLADILMQYESYANGWSDDRRENLYKEAYDFLIEQDANDFLEPDTFSVFLTSAGMLLENVLLYNADIFTELYTNYNIVDIVFVNHTNYSYNVGIMGTFMHGNL